MTNTNPSKSVSAYQRIIQSAVAASLCRRTPKYIPVTLIEASQLQLLYDLEYDLISRYKGSSAEPVLFSSRLAL